MLSPKVTLGAAALATSVVGGLSALPDAARAEAPQWCQDIAGGIFCAAPEEKVPGFCGTKEITLAWADGFAANPWRQLSAATAIHEASRCPNVTGWEHTDGQGSTQKAIADLEGLVAKGTDAIVVFADAGPSLLPAIRNAFQQGATVVPFRVDVGGEEGVDYSAYVAADMHNDGLTWGHWIAKAMGGKGKIAYLSGSPGNSQGTQRAEGIAEALAQYPEIEWVGQQPFEVTNWDNALSVQVLTALTAKYPDLGGIIADMSFPIVSSGVFERAGLPLPIVAGEDYNALGCAYGKFAATGEQPGFVIGTTSSQNWGIRLAVRHAVAIAAGGTVDEALQVAGPDGQMHTVSEPGEKVFRNFVVTDTTAGLVSCDTALPDTSPGGTSLTTEQSLEALKGGL